MELLSILKGVRDRLRRVVRDDHTELNPRQELLDDLFVDSVLKLAQLDAMLLSHLNCWFAKPGCRHSDHSGRADVRTLGRQLLYPSDILDRLSFPAFDHDQDRGRTDLDPDGRVHFTQLVRDLVTNVIWRSYDSAFRREALFNAGHKLLEVTPCGQLPRFLPAPAPFHAVAVTLWSTCYL